MRIWCARPGSLSYNLASAKAILETNRPYVASLCPRIAVSVAFLATSSAVRAVFSALRAVCSAKRAFFSASLAAFSSSFALISDARACSLALSAATVCNFAVSADFFANSVRPFCRYMKNVVKQDIATINTTIDQVAVTNRRLRPSRSLFPFSSFVRHSWSSSFSLLKREIPRSKSSFS